MFRIKICGVTSVEDAVLAVEAGADAVGVNFYPRSPRRATAEAAAAIVRAVGARALVVGVFVNERPEVVREICGAAGFSAVQLAGDEPPGDAARIALPRIKSVRPAGGGLGAVRDYPCEAFLVDAGNPGEYGGTGRRLDWASLSGGLTRDGRLHGRPWVLAGGLTPGNVAGAARAARPAGVDVASGVESEPGKKDPAKLRAFIIAAKEGLGIAAS